VASRHVPASARRAGGTVCLAMGCLLLRAAAAAHFSPGDILAITGGIYTNTSVALVVRPIPAQSPGAASRS